MEKKNLQNIKNIKEDKLKSKLVKEAMTKIIRRSQTSSWNILKSKASQCTKAISSNLVRVRFQKSIVD